MKQYIIAMINALQSGDYEKYRDYQEILVSSNNITNTEFDRFMTYIEGHNIGAFRNPQGNEDVVILMLEEYNEL